MKKSLPRLAAQELSHLKNARHKSLSMKNIVWWVIVKFIDSEDVWEAKGPPCWYAWIVKFTRNSEIRSMCKAQMIYPRRVNDGNEGVRPESQRAANLSEFLSRFLLWFRSSGGRNGSLRIRIYGVNKLFLHSSHMVVFKERPFIQNHWVVFITATTMTHWSWKTLWHF